MMIYPVKRRIWYKGQRFDTIDIESLPYVIPSITGNDVFYRIKCISIPFGVSIIHDDTVSHITNVCSIWISPKLNTICLSHGDGMFYPKDSSIAINYFVDISNKFVNINEYEEGARIYLYTMPDFRGITNDSEIKYPYKWAVPFRNGTVGTDSNDEVMPIRYIQYEHVHPLNPPHPVNVNSMEAETEDYYKIQSMLIQ